MIFTFAVEVSSHDLLKQGVTAARLHGSQHTHHRVTVAAADEVEAQIIAAQMAVATCGYYTRTLLRV